MTNKLVILFSILNVVVVGSSSVAAVAQTKPDQETAGTATLPGGASSLSETHGDWTVNCRIVENTKLCSFSRQQFDDGSKQRVLAVELTPRDAGSAGGTMVLPFGLALQNGVALQIDDKKLEGTVPFSTCLAVGCLVPLSFDSNLIAQMKTGTVLKVNAVAIEKAQPITFEISLNGFSRAMARTAELLAD